jgi:hypothetical protein
VSQGSWFWRRSARRALSRTGGYRMALETTAAPSGAYVAPRFGPATTARYFDARARSGTVAANEPSLRVRTPVKRTQPRVPKHVKQSRAAASLIGVPSGVGEKPVTGRPAKVARPSSNSVRPLGRACNSTIIGAPRQREKRNSTAPPFCGRQACNAQRRPSGVRRSTCRNGIAGAPAGRLTSGPRSRPPGSTRPRGGIRSVWRTPAALQLTSAYPDASTRSAGRVAFSVTVIEAAAGLAARSAAATRIGARRRTWRTRAC